MEKRFEAMMVLHSLGDTMGFQNGYWIRTLGKELTLDVVNEFVYEFIKLGGINGIDISEWKTSDNTLYHLSVTRTMLKYVGKINNKLISNGKNELIKSYNVMAVELINNIFDRVPEPITLKSISVFTEKTDEFMKPYNSTSVLYGCAVRSLCIGLCLYGKNKREELVDVAVRLGKMTHNSPIGFLGGITTALFVAFSIEGIDVTKWGYKLIDILKSNKVKKHLNKDSIEEMSDYLTYLKYWKIYLGTKFKDGKIIENKSKTNLMLRVKYYNEHFVINTQSSVIGKSAFSACIISYDCLLDCDGKWEKLIFYTAMFPGAGDAVSAIAGGLFGIQYGYSDTPKILLDNMEFSKQLKLLGKKIYNKYYGKNS